MSVSDGHVAEELLFESRKEIDEATIQGDLGSLMTFTVDHAFDKTEKAMSSLLMDSPYCSDDSPNTDVTSADTFAIESLAMKSFQMSTCSEPFDGQDNTMLLVNEGPDTKVYHLPNPEDKLGGKEIGALAIKMLDDNFPSNDQIDHLKNEYNISTHLSKCPATRTALRQAEFDGCIALVLEWASGVTLRDWICALHKRENSPYSTSQAICDNDLKNMLQVAWKISMALADIHDFEVAHNDIKPEHIIIDTNQSNGEISVKIIGLGCASIQDDSETVPCKKLNDLESLGAVLFEIFSGQKPFIEEPDNDSPESETKKQLMLSLSRNELFSKLTSRVPLFLAKLIFNVIRADGNLQQLQLARDLEKALHNILLDFDTLTSNSNFYPDVGRLSFDQDKLYGRTSHLSMLLDTCNEIGTENSARVVLVSGYSGAGKSALVEQVKAPLREKGAHFISGKFDHLQHAKPLSAVIAAITECCDEIIRLGPESIQRAKTAINDAFGTETGVLTEVFPSLHKIVGKLSAAPVTADYFRAGDRFKFIFQMFLRALATPSHPIILFMDDLQWADEFSLELVRALIMDTNNRNFLFIGTYRCNEVNNEHPLSKQLDEFKLKNIGIREVVVDSLTKEVVNELISDAMKIHSRLTKPLADIVYQKTSGNAFFVTQFLKSLWDEDLLSYSIDSKMWKWNLEAIEMKNISENVGALMSEKILQLPPETQVALKLLSCIGSKCNQSILPLVLQPNLVELNQMADQVRIFNILKLAVDEGLLKISGPNYMFAHDQIQRAAYSLMTESEREHFHHEIGCSMCKHLSDDVFEDVIFIAVDQLNESRSFAERNEQAVELAKLNLRAGNKAMSLAAFSSAASYFRTGMSLLCDGHWMKQYTLSLSLYSARAEAEYCNGNFQEVGHATGAVLQNAMLHQDKLRAYASVIKALGAQDKPQDALDLGVSVLDQLGVNVLSSLDDKEGITAGLLNTIQTFEKMTDDDVLNLKVMEDTVPINAMKFLSLFCFYAIAAKQEYVCSIATQMLQLTFRHGLCKESALAFGFFSYLLAGSLNGLKTSLRSGNLALVLLEKLEAKEYMSRTYLSVYGGIKALFGSIKVCEDGLLEGYMLGMQTGDIEYAMMNAYTHLNRGIIFGHNLTESEKEFETFTKQMIEYKQTTLRQMVLPFEEATRCLVHSSCCLHLLNFASDLCESMGNAYVVSTMYSAFSWVAYIFGEYEVAADLVQRRWEYENQIERKYEAHGVVAFYDGLIFLAMERKTEEDKWASYAAKSLLHLNRYVEVGVSNTENKVLLLEAEIGRNKGEIGAALSKYKLAIAAAGKHELIQEEAIINERAADFIFSQGDSLALQYYSRAHSLYLQWGANGKAECLCKNIPF